MIRPARLRLLLVAALLVVVAGAATLVVGLSSPVAFGWFAYAPLSGETLPSSGGYLVPTAAVVAAAVLAAGLVALALWWGIRRGSRVRDDA